MFLLPDKPSEPVGPLEVNILRRGCCKLRWGPSQDDGGKSIINYRVEMKEKGAGNWVHYGDTKPHITECIVEGLRESQNYSFRVKAINEEGESPPLELDIYIDFTDGIQRF